MKRTYKYKGSHPALAMFFGRFTVRWAVFETDEGYDSFWLTEAEAEAQAAEMRASIAAEYEDDEELAEAYETYPVIIEVEGRDEQPVWGITREEFETLAAECEVVEVERVRLGEGGQP